MNLRPKTSEFEAEFGRGSRKLLIYAQKQVSFEGNLGVDGRYEWFMPKMSIDKIKVV